MKYSVVRMILQFANGGGEMDIPTDHSQIKKYVFVIIDFSMLSINVHS